MNNPMGQGMPPQAYQLGSFIEENFAIRLSDSNYRALEYFLPKRLEKLQIPFEKYMEFLIRDFEKNGNEIRVLLDKITVQETYFFRDSGQFKALVDVVLPNLIEKNRNSRSIRIWSAGCSTGEEPYTIGILLKEHFPHLSDWNILIRATDVNIFALDKARNGLYTAHSFRGVSDYYKRKYFTPNGNQLALIDSIKKMVQFDYFNLASDSFSPVGLGNPWDVIFCRNVLIYFHRERIVSLLDRFHEALRPGGFLFLGFSENLQFFSNKFKAIHYKNSFFYTKETKQELPGKRPISRPVSRNVPARIPKNLQSGSTLPIKKSKSDSFASKFQRIHALFAKEFYRQAWEKLEKLDSIPSDKKLDVFFLKARLQVNLLHFDEARKTLQAILQEDPLYKEAYFLKALLSRNENDLPAAIANFRKVLYVDSDYILARLYLGDVYHILKQKELALREYRNALRILRKDPTVDLGPFSAGFDAKLLLQILTNKIANLEKKLQSGVNYSPVQ